MAYTNHVTIAAPRNGTTTHTVHPDGTGGTVVDGSAFTPTSGRLLICGVNGGVTSTTPTGWTLPTNGSAISSTGLYIWHRTASGTSADQVATTHNDTNYPVVFDFYEFVSGSSFTSAATATGVANGGAGPTLSGLTGTKWVAGILGVVEGSTTSAITNTWNAGTEEVDTAVIFSTTDGYSYSLTYTGGSTASTAQFAATSTFYPPTGGAERLVIAVNDVAPVTNVTRVGVTTGAPAAATAFTPTLPTHATDDRMVLAVVGKYETTTVPTINQGWTLVGSGTGGTGTAANDTGQTFWAVYAKDATSGSETAPTVTPGGTAPNSWEWVCASHRFAAGMSWADAIGASAAWVTSASDTNTASPLTGTAGAWTGVQPTTDDAIFAVGVIPTDLGTALGATTITATGLSGGTKDTATSQYQENALGQDSAAVWAGWTEFTGTASAGLALSFTVTGATNQSGSLIAIALRQQAGGTNYTEIPTDDAGLTDTALLDRLLVLTDSVGLADTEAFDQTESLTDLTGLTDTAALTISPTVTDSAGLTDTSLVQSGKVVDATDSAGLVDAAVLTRNLVYTDDVGLTDTAALPRALELTDSAGLTDAAVAQAAKFTTVDDSTGLTDTAVLARALVYTDSAGLVDAPALARSLVYTDSSGLTDTATVQAAKLLVVTDSAGLTDVGLTLNVAEDFTDLTGLTDTTSIAATGAAIYTDSTGLTDTRVFARSLGVADSAGLTDTVSPALSGAGVFTDSAGLIDTTAFVQSNTVTDDAGLTDARVIDLAKTQTDSAGLTDGTSISSGKILDFTDSAGLTDSLTSSQAKSVTDDAGLTDTPIFAAAKVLTDSAGLTDVALVIGQRDITITDSAGLTDTRVVVKGLEPTDSVGLTDSQAFAAAYRYTDSAGLTDTSIIDLQVPVVFGRGASRQGNAQTGSTGRALVGSGRAGRG